MSALPPNLGRPTGEDEPPPFLGTWLRVYLAIVLLTIAVICALTAFSYWSF
jgi:hypothetical protein